MWGDTQTWCAISRKWGSLGQALWMKCPSYSLVLLSVPSSDFCMNVSRPAAWLNVATNLQGGKKSLGENWEYWRKINENKNWKGPHQKSRLERMRREKDYAWMLGKHCWGGPKHSRDSSSVTSFPSTSAGSYAADIYWWTACNSRKIKK